MRALITGATGFIGRRLITHLDRPRILSRDAGTAEDVLGDVEAIGWNPESGPPPQGTFDGIDTVFHLAGEPVAEGRWTVAKKERIRKSREISTRNLVVGIERAAHRPKVLVSASATGYYGSRGDTILDEKSAPGDDFLARVCVTWELEAQRATDFGVRVVNPRTGIVLGEQGGALAKMLPLFKLGLGGRLGDGRQFMSWIHIDDVVGLLLHAAEHLSIRGPMNTVSPNPVTNREFTKVLAGVLKRPAFLPAPTLGLRVLLGEVSDILLASQRVVPDVALDSGYKFQHSDLEEAIRAVVSHGAETGHAAVHAETH